MPDSGCLGVLAPRAASPTAPAGDLLSRALDAPDAGAPLADRLRGVRRVTVLVPDRTRWSAQELYAPLLVERLTAAGIAPAAITVLFATGTHAGHSAAERRALVAADRLPPEVVLHDHDANDATAMVSLGQTPRGTPVSVHRAVVDADLVLLTGTLSYHYLAGYGGGRKCLAPGVAARETCLRLHRWTIQDAGPTLRHPGCAPGCLAGNPFHEELNAACRLLRTPMFLLNTLLTPAKQMLGAVAGDWEAAHVVGARRWDDGYAAPLPHSVDLVVASCGGWPKDINLYQAHKSILHACRALKPGGALVMLAACEDGAGSPALPKWLALPDASAHAEALRANFDISGQTAWSLRDLAARHRIWLVTDMDPALPTAAGMHPVRTVTEALRQAAAVLPRGATCCVIPDAGWVLPTPATR